MFKKLAILAVATFWLVGIDLHPDTAPPRPQRPRAAKTSARAPSKRAARVSGSSAQRARSRRRARRRRYNPWRLSSFGEPASDDNPAGEDAAIRQAALDALGNWNGSIVVVDPNSGRVLSIVNQRLALSSGFTPCSTFKPVVALGALKEGIITPKTRIVGDGGRRVNVTDALAKSNNRFFSKLGEMLGFTRLTRYAHEFGLGEPASRSIPGESPGRFPSAPPKQGGVGYLAYYGQDMEVTPLQMAALISAIANGGTLYELQYPRVPEEQANFRPIVRRRLDDLAAYIPQVREGLAAAVLYGTGRSAYDPDLSIYGKTGTCSEDGARLGWFVSYADDLQAKYVVVVLLRGGRMMFGPHAAEIAGRLYRELRDHGHNATQANRLGAFANPAQR